MVMQTLGVVLKKSAYQEDRVLLDLFTEQHGKIKVLARRSRKARYSDQIFELGHWQLKAGKVFYFAEDYDSVQHAFIKGLNVWSGYYLNELLMRLMSAHHADSSLFTHYWRALAALEHADADLQEWMLRTFEKALLETLGSMPDLTADSEGDEIQANLNYYVGIEAGLSKHPFKMPTPVMPGHHILTLQMIEETHQYQRLDRPLLQHYKRMMRFLLQPLLGKEPLQSRLWLQSLHAKQQSTPLSDTRSSL
ncbi:DNA repair protein RecO [Wohlfahrtiimonas chitiniclastica]|nr:DNA repair protein RecO [Wohlfahrtiimonas chitiniclastica]MBS7837803.1 DNA repair protein RecO [Wohlfahrtiimonas chitiniclastica]MDC7251581.1 DNA repair protein RecO [Wohlfahrtiimonas chitiniclastica]OYQ89957.1 DNA repair protein RecO [Wohlfahrtiimonas chitiniclastica]